MPLRDVNIDELEERHLREQVELGVPEVRDVDYKRTLPWRSEASEFLADVCSLANAGGGDLVYGMEEEAGIPTALPGVESGNPDADLLAMEGRILTGITPRVPGLRGRYVPLENGRHAFVIRVPRSFARPHAVLRNETPRFVTRNSAGKYTMDVDEIRAAFLASNAVAERMRAFRVGRLSDLASGQGPFDAAGLATVVLHVLPLAAFDVPAPVVETGRAPQAPEGFLPIGMGGRSTYNFDGLLVRGSSRTRAESGGRRPESYALLFRSGAVEAADTDILWPEPDGRIIPSVVFEGDILDSAERYVALLDHLGVAGPVYVGLSLLGVRGYEMAVRRSFGPGAGPVDRDALVVPEVMAEGPGLDRPAVEALMRPVFDQVWNACGHARSFLYHADGRWVGRRP